MLAAAQPGRGRAAYDGWDRSPQAPSELATAGKTSAPHAWPCCRRADRAALAALGRQSPFSQLRQPGLAVSLRGLQGDGVVHLAAARRTRRCRRWMTLTVITTAASTASISQVRIRLPVSVR
jgi:hypothetical protein